MGISKTLFLQLFDKSKVITFISNIIYLSSDLRMSFRTNNYAGSYLDHNKLGYSSVSKNHAYSNRSNPIWYLDQGGYGDDHNFGEIEFML